MVAYNRKNRWLWTLGAAVMLASCQSEPPISAIPPESPVESESPMPESFQYYKGENLGLAFDYPAGFVVDESQIEPGKIELWTQKDYVAVQNNEFLGSELPPNVSVAVRENTENLPLQDWIMQDSWFVNPEGLQSREVAGREGLAFRGTGLYESQYVVVSQGDRVIVMTWAESSAYQAAFEQIVATLALSEETASSPRFEDYPVTEIVTKPPVAVDLESHPQARRFRTALQNGVQEGANFAGQYAVVTWGCGTSCQQVAIVDITTGEVNFVENVAEAGVEYRVDSRLLAINPPEQIPTVPEGITPQYWLWQGGALQQLN